MIQNYFRTTPFCMKLGALTCLDFQESAKLRTKRAMAYNVPKCQTFLRATVP